MNNNNNLFNQVVNNTQPNPPAHGHAVAGFVLGILSVAVLVINAFTAEVTLGGSLVMGIVGIVLTTIAKKRGNNSGIRKAGFVLSIIGTALNGAAAAACFGLIGCPACVVCSGLMSAM